jgi:hypothetical protein
MIKDKKKLRLAWGLNAILVGAFVYVLSLVPVAFWGAIGVCIALLGKLILVILAIIIILGLAAGVVMLAVPTFHYVLKWFNWSLRYALGMKEPEFPPKWTFKASWCLLGRGVASPWFWLPCAILVGFILILAVVHLLGVGGVFAFSAIAVLIVGMYIVMMEDCY